MTDTDTFTPARILDPDGALPQQWPPVVLGRETPNLHRADTSDDQYATPEGLFLACKSAFALRMARPRAVLPGKDKWGGCDDDVLLTAFLRLRVRPKWLCKRCFGAELIGRYRSLHSTDPLLMDMLAWEWQNRQTRRTVTVSAEAAAVIAEAVAFAADEPAAEGEPVGQPRTEPVTVTLSGHADALVAGMVGPPDTGNSTVTDDRKRVWKQGIHASDDTWREVHEAFPLSLVHERDMSTMDFHAVLAEVREAFPLAVFRKWADQSLRFQNPDIRGQLWDNLAHYYDPEAGL
jgi:hypothetical protein